MKRAVAFDVGSHTIGVAQSDLMRMFAHPVKTFRTHEDNWQNALTLIFSEINLKEIDTYVVGLPKTLKNNASESTKRAERFYEILTAYLEAHAEADTYKIVYLDERFSTQAAENILLSVDMKRKNRKKVIDTVAAVVILENYLAAYK